MLIFPVFVAACLQTTVTLLSSSLVSAADVIQPLSPAFFEQYLNKNRLHEILTNISPLITLPDTSGDQKQLSTVLANELAARLNAGLAAELAAEEANRQSLGQFSILSNCEILRLAEGHAAEQTAILAAELEPYLRAELATMTNNYRPFATVMPDSEMFTLLALGRGCMKWHLSQAFMPGSVLWPESPPAVEEAVKWMLKDASLSREVVIDHVLKLSRRFVKHGNIAALARLTQVVPKHLFTGNWQNSHDASSVAYELARWSPSNALLLIDLTSGRIDLDIFAGIFAAPVDPDILNPLLDPSINPLLNPQFIQSLNIPINPHVSVGIAVINSLLDAISRSCTLSFASQSDVSSEFMFNRNVALIHRLDTCAQGCMHVRPRVNFARLINYIRFNPSFIGVTLEVFTEMVGQVRDPSLTSDPCARTYDVLLAAVYGKRRPLVEDVWNHEGLTTVPDELRQALTCHPDVLEYVPDSPIKTSLLAKLSPLAQVQLAEFRGGFDTEPDLPTRLVRIARNSPSEFEAIVAESINAASEYNKMALIRQLESAATGIIEGVDNPVPFVFSIMTLLGNDCVRFSSDILGNEKFLRALFLKQENASVSLVIFAGLCIVPAPSFIRALLSDSVLATAFASDHFKPVRDSFSTAVLTNPVKYPLSSPQILRLLNLFHCALHETSFTFAPDRENVTGYRWQEHCAPRTFGVMAAYVALPGFFAHLAHAVGTREIQKDLKMVAAAAASQTSSEEKLDVPSADTPSHEGYWSLSPALRVSVFQASIASAGLFNPTLLGGFSLLNLWHQFDPSNFERCAPRLAIRAFIPRYPMEVFKCIVRAGGANIAQCRTMAQIYLHGVTLRIGSSLDEQPFRNNLSPVVSKILKDVACRLEYV